MTGMEWRLQEECNGDIHGMEDVSVAMVTLATEIRCPLRKTWTYVGGRGCGPRCCDWSLQNTGHTLVLHIQYANSEDLGNSFQLKSPLFTGMMLITHQVILWCSYITEYDKVLDYNNLESAGHTKTSDSITRLKFKLNNLHNIHSRLLFFTSNNFRSHKRY